MVVGGIVVEEQSKSGHCLSPETGPLVQCIEPVVELVDTDAVLVEQILERQQRDGCVG